MVYTNTAFVLVQLCWFNSVALLVSVCQCWLRTNTVLVSVGQGW